jgi:ATP-binding cassette, subfamily B (MDR/TAP), member 1
VVNHQISLILRIAFGWKLALVACSLIPVGVMAGYMRTHLLATLDTQMREAYKKAATLACDQVAAIRTVASLKREIALHKEFCQSLKTPMRKALRSTLGSAAVCPSQGESDFTSYMPSAKAWPFL